MAQGYELLNTKAVAPTFKAAHAIRGSRMNLIGKGIFMGTFKKPNDPVLFIMDNSIELLDINYEWEFKMCEILFRQRKEFKDNVLNT